MENETEVQTHIENLGEGLDLFTDEVEPVAEPIAEEPSIIYGLVDVSGDKKSLVFLTVAPLEEITLWQKLFKLQGKETRVLDETFTTEELQYLYWNTTRLAPPSDVDALRMKVNELVSTLTVDPSTCEELRARIDAESATNDELAEQLQPEKRITYQDYVSECNKLHEASLSQSDWVREGSLSLPDLKIKWGITKSVRKEGEDMGTKKGPLLKPSGAKAAKAAKAAKTPKEPKAPKPAKVAKEKKPKAARAPKSDAPKAHNRSRILKWCGKIGADAEGAQRVIKHLKLGEVNAGWIKTDLEKGKKGEGLLPIFVEGEEAKLKAIALKG